MMNALEVDPIGAMGLVDESGHARLGKLDARTFDTTAPVVAVCRSGNRSGAAATKLAAAGATVYNLVGGMKAWREIGQSVIRDAGTAGTVI